MRITPLLGTAVLVGCLLPAVALPALAGQVRRSNAGAQAALSDLVELRLRDGSVIYGVIQAESADRITVRTIGGTVVTVERGQVLSLRPARGRVVNGEFRPADANATRLMFGPTGRSLTRGEGYVGVYEFLLPFVQVGITDRFSMGAGTPLLFVGDETVHPIWVTPKYQFYKSARTSAAVGLMHFFVVGDDARLGFAYIVATTGSDDNALTTGVGWAYARYRETETDFSGCFGPTPASAAACAVSRTSTTTHGSPIFMIGGERRLTRRVKFVTENYAFDGGGLVAVGIRFLGERLSTDLGVFAPLSGDEIVVAPIVNFVWTFGGHAVR